MSNPNPGSSAGGIGPALSERAEAPSDPDWNAPTNPDAPFDGKGMTVDDAVASSYDDHQTATDGIAEGDRVKIGQNLKYHADSAGVSVVDGLDALLQPAITLRHGSQQDKRALMGHFVDEYAVQDVPMAAQAAPAEYGPAEGATAAENRTTVENFIAANPIAADAQIQEGMTHVLGDMARQGFQPDLGRALQIAIDHHPHYSQQAQQAQQAGQVAEARAAAVQVSGSGTSSPNQTSDDLADIISELTPSF